jgi:Cu+-exporting ATPase
VDPLSVAAALAQLSTHPLSQAIAANVTGKARIIVDSSTEVRGGGIEAEVRTVNGKLETARLGSLRWLQSHGVVIVEDHPFVRKWTDEAASLVGVALDDRLLCLFALKDTLKPDAQNVIRELSESGLRIYLVTGDNRRTAQSIARQLALPAENVFAEVRPEEKAEVVKKLQAEGQRVAFVGDGINDAPALEQADLGIAVSRASEVAREAADIVLLNSEISAVPQALKLARSTLRVIKQNLFWAFFYNALGIPLAALGFMSPILCAAAMGLSDVVVIGNALRLLRR